MKVYNIKIKLGEIKAIITANTPNEAKNRIMTELDLTEAIETYETEELEDTHVNYIIKKVGASSFIMNNLELKNKYNFESSFKIRDKKIRIMLNKEE